MNSRAPGLGPVDLSPVIFRVLLFSWICGLLNAIMRNENCILNFDTRGRKRVLGVWNSLHIYILESLFGLYYD